jgi:hypothetical protein
MRSLHLREPFDGVGIWITVDHVVMDGTEQEEVLAGLSIRVRLIGIVARPPLALRFDVTDPTGNLPGHRLDNPNCAIRESTSVSREGEEFLYRGCGGLTHD